VIELRNDTSGAVRILTKGDYNPVDDRGLYAPGQQWLSPQDIVGRAKAYVPYVGMATILMNDYPKLKYLLLATLAFTVITAKE
jgi:signal peptidase